MKYLSLFSGIGGFEYGLQQSEREFDCVGFSEVDDFAKSIYTRWFPNHRDLGDAREIETSQLPDFELLVAGFPCQAFSISGERQGFCDTRGTLFFEIERILADKTPRYFLLENVLGLLSHDGGRTFKTMLGVLSELGYDVEWENINSSDFTAQNRERIYLKGYFREKCGGEILSLRRGGREVHPVGVDCKAVVFDRQVRKRVHDVDYEELSSFLRLHKKNAKLTTDEIAKTLEKPYSEVEHWFRTDDFFAPPSEDVWEEFKELLGITSNKYDSFITEWEWVDGVYEMDKRAYDDSGLSQTITTNNGSLVKINSVGTINPNQHIDGEIHSIDGLSRGLTATDPKHPVKIKEDGLNHFRIRRLTPKECERLQAFPDDWTKFGKDGEVISDTQRYKCLGNAVTTSVVTYIANTMFGEEYEESG